MKKLSYMNMVYVASVVFFLIALSVLSVYQNKKAESNLLMMEEISNTQLSLMFAHGATDYLEKMLQNPGKTSIETGDYDALFDAVRPQMEKLTVLKIKIFDQQGLTVFSTDPSQVGDDKTNNAGYQSAMAGQPRSELTHRDTFSVFEQEVEDRDVISSYVPVYLDNSRLPSGVYEIYSDVTPVLNQIKATNLRQMIITSALFGVLVISLYLVIRRADRLQRKAVSESEEAKLQLAQSEKMASLGSMVAAVSHELNTPIAYTKSNVEVLRDALTEILQTARIGQRVAAMCAKQKGDSVLISFNRNKILKSVPQDGLMLEPGEIDEMFEQTLSGLGQMSELVKNLRDFTRIDREATQYYNLNESVDTVLYICRSTMPTDIQVNKLLTDVPFVTCMPSEVNQVLINLVQNAGQAGADKIDVKTYADGGQVVISVSDNGAGMSEEVQSKIFESFYTTKERGKGTGLGLFISKDLMQRNGGDLTVTSEPGVGTEFKMVLPVAERRVSAEAA